MGKDRKAKAVKVESKRERLDVPTALPTMPKGLLNLMREEKTLQARPDFGPTLQSSVLSKVMDFLPQLSSANESLFKSQQSAGEQDSGFELVEMDEEEQREGKESLVEELAEPTAGSDDSDIDSEQEGETAPQAQQVEPRIEMDLTCGILDLKTPDAIQKAAILAGEVSEDESDSEDDDGKGVTNSSLLDNLKKEIDDLKRKSTKKKKKKKKSKDNKGEKTDKVRKNRALGVTGGVGKEQRKRPCIVEL